MTQVSGKPTFATFWHGNPLSPFELACLSSFVHHGYEVTVFSYEPLPDFPKWLNAADASTVVRRESMMGFKVDGKPSLAHFSDYFRLVMFQKTNHVWIDTDVVLLRPFDISLAGNIMSRDSPEGICNAVLHLANDDPRLEQIVAKVAALMGKPQRYGDTGPRLLTYTYGFGEVLPGDSFYPIRYQQYHRVLLPRYRAECEERCKGAYTLHLWNDLMVKTGIHKWEAPPEGSYLHRVFETVGALRFFRGNYPEKVMEILVYNAVVKLDAGVGIRRAVGLLVREIRRAVERRASRFLKPLRISP